MKLGIVGKINLFNSLTKAGAESANYPFCTIEPNIGTVLVPDERLEVLTKMYDSLKTTYATIEFVDIAGLVKGASKGEGLGNKFLSHIREVDAIVHVVRCFEDKNIVHVEGKIDPLDDIETISLELIFSDVETVNKRLERANKAAKSHDKAALMEVDALNKLKDALENGKPARSVELSDEEKSLLTDLFLLTSKKVIYIANVNEDQLLDVDNDANVNKVKEFASQEGAICIPLCAKLEEELSELDDEDRQALMQDYGMTASGLDLLAVKSYELLNLMSYLTAGKTEVRAWTITKGTKAPGAAGKIHSDFERGFIKAEIVSYDDLIACGTYAAARDKGLVRLEGKEYVVQDGDIILFKFNV